MRAKLFLLVFVAAAAGGALAKVTLQRAVTIEELNELAAEAADRKLRDRELKIVGVLTLPISRLLRNKIAEHMQQQASKSEATSETTSTSTSTSSSVSSSTLTSSSSSASASGTHFESNDFASFEKSSFFAASYASWLKAQGVQIVPIDVFSDSAELETLVRALDGVLFTGGAVPLFHRESKIELDSGIATALKKELSPFSLRLKQIVQLVKRINVEEKRHFPLWTTCLGFEGLILGESDVSLPLSDVDNSNNSAAVSLALADRAHSPFLRFFKPAELELMQKENLFFFNHEHAFLASRFAQNEALGKNYRVVATARPKAAAFDEPIVAIIEHVSLPLYGVQFHPEKNRFERQVRADTSERAVALTDRLAEFFCSQLRGEHKEEDLIVIRKYLAKFEYITANNVGVFNQLYIFKPKVTA